jgi:hypothetical protein
MGVRAAEAVFQEATYSAQDTSNNSTTIYSGPCVYYGGIVTTALSAHAVLVRDGASGATIDAFVASSAVGTKSNFPVGIRLDTGLVIDPDDSSTGNITLFYRPLASFSP